MSRFLSLVYLLFYYPLVKFLTDEEETWIKKNVVLQKNADNIMSRVFKQQGNFKKNGNKNKKDFT